MGQINYTDRPLDWSFDKNNRLYMIYALPSRNLERDVKVYYDKRHTSWKFSQKGMCGTALDTWIDLEYDKN
jgi:hypothetical protein